MKKNKNLKVVFMGTPEFAVPAFNRMCEDYTVVCVYTREPKPKGRGYEEQKTPIHELALQRGIAVRTPKSLGRDPQAQDDFAAIDADISVVCAYGLLLPPKVIYAFKYPCINIHGSLLPKYRGAAPIQRAVMNGDEKTGITIMKIAEGMDTGDMLLKREMPIPEDMNVQEAFDKLSVIGADLVSEAIGMIVSGSMVAEKQDGAHATHAAKIEKGEYQIDFTQNVKKVHDLVRGLYPSAYFEHNGERICIVKAHYEKGSFGDVGILTDNGRAVCCTGGKLVFEILKRAGKKAMGIEEFLRGYKFAQV